MSESASVEVLCAEVRVLQVGSGQITLSMCRQLDEATFERFEPFGRVRDMNAAPRRELQLVGRDTETSALVRCDAYPPDGSPRKGPLNLRHGCCTPSNPGRAGTRLPTAPADARWYGPGVSTHCPAPYGWHVSQDNRPGRWLMRGAPQMPLEERAKRCTVDLGELEQAWSDWG